MRNIIGAVLALVGAAATLASPWQAWYNGRHGSTYKFWEVFGSGITDSRSGVTDSVFLIFLITAVVCVVGVVMRSRVLVGVAGVVALGFTILWMVRQGNAAGELTISGTTNRGLGSGVGNALGGSLLMVIGAVVMTGRPAPAVAGGTTARTADSTAAAPAASTRAYDSGRTDAQTATDRAPAATPAPTAGSGTDALSPEDRALLDRLDEPPKDGG